MAALLLVAREKVMAGFNGRMYIRQFICEETAVMHADERKLTGCGKRGKWASVFKDKRLVMTSALELLVLFERAGDCIEAYAQSVRSEVCCYDFHLCLFLGLSDWKVVDHMRIISSFYFMTNIAVPGDF